MQTLSGQDAFSNLIRSYEYHREQILILSRQIRIRIREYDNELYSLLKTISGIGPLTSSCINNRTWRYKPVSSYRSSKQFCRINPQGKAKRRIILFRGNNISLQRIPEDTVN